MENKKVHINCIGTCIIRDIVGMHDNDAGYMVDKFVQEPNPISIVGKSPLIKNLEVKDVFFDKSNFYQRCISLDLEKHVFEYIREGKEGSYVLIDFGCMRRLIFETNEGCGTVVFPEKLPMLLERGYISEYSIKPTLAYSKEEIYTCLDRYFEELLQIYKEEQIIIVDVRCCLYTSNNITKRLGVFNEQEIKSDNEAIDIAYQYALFKLPRAHVIPFPLHMMCDVHHKWGNIKLHYIKEYYKYALVALDTITCGRYDTDTEKIIISSLCDDTDKFCIRRKEEFTYFTTKYKVELDDLCGRYKAYEQYFKTVAMENKTDMLEKFFKSCKFHTIGFYGLNEISKFYIDMILKMEFFTDDQMQNILIIENGNAEYKGLNVCPRDSKEYLGMDSIIVCDIMNIKRIKDKLERLCFHGNVTDLYEIINVEKP